MWDEAARSAAHAVARELEGQRKVTAGQQDCHRVLRCLLPVGPWFLRLPNNTAQQVCGPGLLHAKNWILHVTQACRALTRLQKLLLPY